MNDHDFVDDRNYVCFEDVIVLRRCPECCKFIKEGKLSVNGLDQVKLTGWICKVHGEVKPECSWI